MCLGGQLTSASGFLATWLCLNVLYCHVHCHLSLLFEPNKYLLLIIFVKFKIFLFTYTKSAIISILGIDNIFGK